MAIIAPTHTPITLYIFEFFLANSSDALQLIFIFSIVKLNSLSNDNWTKKKGKVSCGEVGLPMKDSDMILPCGIFGRWECW